MPKSIIIFFGPPGSGKGTQADLLSKKTGWKKISTGDLLRAEVAAKTDLGKSVDKLLKAGKLVSDKIVVGLVDGSMKKKMPGFIFDGYPRNMKQLKDLLQIFEKRLKKSDQIQAILVEVSDKEVKRRLGLRRMCVCGAVYHMEYNPPINDSICDICGRKLFMRNDDKPTVIVRRLKVYHKEGEPILGYFKKEDKLIKINGEQPIKRIHEDIMERLRGVKIV